MDKQELDTLIATAESPVEVALAQEIAALADNAQRWHNDAMKWRAAHTEQVQNIVELQTLLTSSGPDPRVVALAAQCREQAQEIARLRNLTLKLL